MKRRTEIEALLQWAYRDELSKRYISAAEGIWDRIHDNGSLGGIDPGHGAAQRYAHFGLPHPDAEAIEIAVSALPDLIIDWELSREAVMGDMAPLLKARETILVCSLRTAALVTMHAKMGTRPDWREEEPRPYPVAPDRGPAGKPAIVGECKGHNIYTYGSHCPIRWRPSPISIAEQRADYVCWHRGLSILAENLCLSAHTVLPPVASALPWNDAEGSERRIYSIGEQTKTILPLKPRRERFAGRKRAQRASPVRYPLDMGAKA